MESGVRVVAVVGDLFFRSKIQETASLSGVPIAFATTAPELEEALEAGGVGIVIVDLGTRSLDPAAAIALARRTPGTRTIAYVSHVDEAAMRRAREAGCDDVLPKSAFTRDLPRLLRQGVTP